MSNFENLRKLNAKENQLDIGFTAGEIKSNPQSQLGELVEGCEIFDSNVNGWRTGHCIGLIGHSGNGKTSWILHNFKRILQNKKSGYCVMFALEMTDQELSNKWHKVIEDDEDLSKRLIIITANNGKDPRDLSIDGINDFLDRIRSVRSDKMWSFAVDHLHIIQKKAPHIDNDSIVERFMRLAQIHDSLGILTSQTTKGKGGAGDIPLGMTACFNCSRFEWYMTQIYTICRPLKRIQSQVNFPATGWKLAKNRFTDPEDKIKVGENYVTYFDFKNESYRNMSEDEKMKFENLYIEASELRKNDVGGDDYVFNYTREIVNNQGKKIVMNKVVSGLKDVDED